MLLITIAKLLLALASFQDQGPLMWTGEKGLASSPTQKDAPALAEALRKELATLVTRTDLQRDYSKQLETLDQLRATACWSNAYPGKPEILSEIAEVRADR